MIYGKNKIKKLEDTRFQKNSSDVKYMRTTVYKHILESDVYFVEFIDHFE